MSFGDFIKFLLILLQREKISLCLADTRPWHSFLYALKNRSDLPNRPAWLPHLFFSSYSYMHCDAFEECLTGLRRSCCLCSWSPSLTEHFVSPEIEKFWMSEYEHLVAPDAQFLASAFEMLKEKLKAVASAGEHAS